MCQLDSLGRTLFFNYGADGVVGFSYMGNGEYFFKKNIQGDVIGICNSEGVEVVKYVYDAWGNHSTYVLKNGNYVDISTIIDYTNIEAFVALANMNPFRYRGYIFDSETSLYYLQSRYYDPQTGRFINADDFSILDFSKDYPNGLNLYAYCFNDPVNATDHCGDMPNWLKWLIGGITFVAAAILTVVTGGALAPVFIGMGVSILSGGVIQGAITAVNGGSFWSGFVNGMADGALWGGVFALASSTVSAIRAVSTAKQGITIGKGMSRVREVAKLNNTAVYKPMKGYNLIKKVSPKLADKLSIYHNKIWINRMMNLNAKVFDIGLGSFHSAGAWYGMELAEIAKRGYQVIKFLF